MQYSFIIPTLNRSRDLENLLRDIANLNWMPEDQFEVVLFNDGADPETATLVKSWSGFPVQYLSSTTRVNSCISRNQSIDRASGEWLIFLDDDVRLAPDFITYVKTVAQSFSGFSFRMELPNKRGAGFLINQLLEDLWPGKILPFFGHFVGGFDKRYEGIKLVDHLPGANMIFRRMLVGGIRFDENLGTGTGYLDDADFSHTIKVVNQVPLAYVSDYSIVHLQAPAGGNRQLDKREWYYFYQNHKTRFFSKHFSHWYLPSVFIFNLVEAITRSITYRANLITIFWRAWRDA